MITIFTPSFADATNTNAQNLTAKEVVARLPPERFKVQMLCASSPDERIAARPNTELLAYRDHWNTARLLTRLLLTRPDMYFFPREGPLDSAFLFLRRRMALRTALVTYVVSTQDQGTPSRVLARGIREADAVVGNSVYVSETITQRFGVPATTIHSGVSRQFFFPPEEGARSGHFRLTVLYAGSFQARKQIPLVIQEAAKWPNVQFKLVGRGEEELACRALAESLKCRNVDFLGHLPPAQVGEEMRRADVFLFPSILEGHPQVLGQAAACGLPCVARDVYRPDYVVNAETGFLVRSEAELSQKLEILLTQPDLRRSMSAAACKLSLNFNWDVVVERWAGLFEGVLRKRQGIAQGEAH
jgi:glycosyltransferase involved in cell wall biosynthesis